MDKDVYSAGRVIVAIWLVLALVARLGLLIYAVGLTRSKHAAATAGRSVLDLCVAALAFWLIGGALAGGGNPYVGFDVHAMLGLNWGTNGRLTQLASVVLASGILAGALSERCAFWPSMIAAAAMGLLVLPLPLRWMDGDGWLAQLGVSGVDPFPIAAAAFAWAGIKSIGPRLNKYHRDGSTSLIPGHSLPLAFIGAALVTIALIGLTTLRTMRPDVSLIAVAAGGLATAIVTQLKYNRPDLGLVMVGLLGAAVATYTLNIAPGPWFVLVGLVAGLVVPHCAVAIDTGLKLDDPPACLSIFGVGGAIGLLAGGLLHAGDAMFRLKSLGAAAVALVVIAIWAGAVGWFTFSLLRRFTRLRVREADEFDGLDLAEHDIGAYPDFQQNTIRSFHMREA